MSLTLAEIRASVRSNVQVGSNSISDEDIDASVNQAISFAKTEKLFVPIADESLEEDTDQYEYPLTGGSLDTLVYIANLFRETETSGEFYPESVPKSLWSVEYSSTPYILLNEIGWNIWDGYNIRVVGYGYQARVTDDEDVVYLPDSYVEWKASAFAHAKLSGGGAGGRAAWHAGQVGYCEGLAEIARHNASEFKVVPNCVLVRGRL